MIAYRKEKIENAICYFVQNQEKITGKNVYKTYVFKYLALFDFRHLQEKGKPSLDIEYTAMENGPVPKEIYFNIESIESDKFEICEDENSNHYFKVKKSCDLDYFSKYELKIMEDLKNEFMKKIMTTKQLIDATHDEILSWRLAWEKRGDRRKVDMTFIDEFENVLNKDEESLTPEEDAFLVFNALKRLNNASCRNFG